MSALIGAETGIKTIAAVHSQCRLWVNRCVSIPPQRRPLSVVAPIGDKRERGWFVREVPILLQKSQIAER
jgi:hypothetical protein